jgi:predicted AAA+ superfamily ATPase
MIMNNDALYHRFSGEQLREALTDTPVILIHGPRQTGKTTLARQIAQELNYHYISFDDNSQQQAALADPLGYVTNLPEYVFLDEVQRVPEIFSSIKISVDNNRKPGRFILTGSANILLLPRLSDSLAGRIEIIHLRPLAQVEIAGQKPKFLQQLFDGSLNIKNSAGQYRRLGESLATIITKGGYPPAVLRNSERRRINWYRDYITTIVQRDIQDLARIQNLDILPRLLSVAASQTARLFIAADLASPFAISRPTIREYLALLEKIFLLERLPPWHNNRLSRVIKTPKLHLVDTGLACTLLGVNSKTLWQDKSLLGQLLETFVYQELRKYADWQFDLLDFYHFRNKDKVEVDIIITRGRQFCGIEVKAAATVTTSDFKGLRKLKEAHPDEFITGVVFYDGEYILPFGEKLFAVPISLLIPQC